MKKPQLLCWRCLPVEPVWPRRRGKNHPSGGGERAVYRRLFERLYRWRAELPLQSDTYQVMRTDQRRYFGHPDLVLFIQRLGTRCITWGWGRC
jgi:hypothetical protein